MSNNAAINQQRLQGLKTIKALCHDYKVKLVNVKDSDTRGSCHTETQEIAINLHLSPSITVETIVHEILHVVDHTMGVPNDETRVSVAARIWATILLENPELLRVLLGYSGLVKAARRGQQSHG